MPFMSMCDLVTVPIGSGGTVGTAYLGGLRVAAIGVQGWTAAAITFRSSPGTDAGTVFEVHTVNSGTLGTLWRYAPPANGSVMAGVPLTPPLYSVELYSGAAAAGTAQAADRVVYLLVTP